MPEQILSLYQGIFLLPSPQLTKMWNLPRSSIYVLVHLCFVANSVVATNSTSETEPSYVPDPPGRGTFDLLSSCIITMSLCVWTAIHINIYPEHIPFWTRFWHKIGWATLALIAPECVLWRAADQFRTARLLSKRVNELHERKSECTPQPSSGTENKLPGSNVITLEADFVDLENRKPEKWGLLHGFFAVMGGFVITLKGRDKYEELFQNRFTITPRGILLLAELDLLPEVSQRIIRARSKADKLAKALVCFQVSWMVIQTTARKISGLPITLIELNTLAHVMCAAILYLVWWNKPQNVSEPIEIPFEPPLAATIFYISSYGVEIVEERTEGIGNATVGRSGKQVASETELEKLNSEISEEYHGLPDSVGAQNNVTEPGWHPLVPPNQSKIKVIGDVKEKWHPGDVKLRRIVTDEMTIYKKLGGVVMLLPGQYLEGIPFTPKAEPKYLRAEDINALQLMSKIRDIPEYATRWEYYAQAGSKTSVCLAKKASNGTIEGNLDELGETETLVLWMILCSLYGGVLATSWNDHFPSFVEKTMWRVATCVIAGGAIVLSGLRYFYKWLLSIEPRRVDRSNSIDNRSTGRLTNIKRIACVLAKNCATRLAHMIFYAFMLSRIYLVIESFISVRSLPLGAYSAVTWTSFFPHIGSS
jgi:hypothetical protein